MTAPTILRHVHLPGITPFGFAQSLQSRLAAQFLAHKALVSSQTPPSELPPAPVPTILTFSPTPVYTTGRRERESLSPEQEDVLKAPLYSLGANGSGRQTHLKPQHAEIVPTLRGGQTTFHGPGQLVIYPILDLRTRFPNYPRGISVRCYVHLLEQCTIDTLSRWGLKGIRTENPGVWEEEGERKIAALGVHLRRNITSYGVGLNVKPDLEWFDRIVACGLVGKGVTSMDQLRMENGSGDDDSHLLESLTVQSVGDAWVKIFAKGIYGSQGEEIIESTKVEDLGFTDLASENLDNVYVSGPN